MHEMRDHPSVRQMFIRGQWISAQDGEEIPTDLPVDGQVFGAVSRGKAYEVDLAVKAAQRALDGAWGRLDAAERGRLMMRIGDKVLENKEELAQLEAQDTGSQ